MNGEESRLHASWRTDGRWPRLWRGRERVKGRERSERAQTSSGACRDSTAPPAPLAAWDRSVAVSCRSFTVSAPRPRPVAVLSFFPFFFAPPPASFLFLLPADGLAPPDLPFSTSCSPASSTILSLSSSPAVSPIAVSAPGPSLSSWQPPPTALAAALLHLRPSRVRAERRPHPTSR